MGQEQSTDDPTSTTEPPATTTASRAAQPPSSLDNSKGTASTPGVKLVAATGAALRAARAADPVDAALRHARQLPLPQRRSSSHAGSTAGAADASGNGEVGGDSLTAALQGAQVMHELRALLDGLMGGVDQMSASVGTAPAAPQTDTTGAALAAEGADNDGNRTDSTHGAGDGAAAVDTTALDTLLCEAAGGARMRVLVHRQSQLLAQICDVGALAKRLETAVSLTVNAARNTTGAIDKLDRLSMSIGDVHDTLEHVVATANILGAAHFADDDEMCSFKNYLRHNPPETS